MILQVVSDLTAEFKATVSKTGMAEQSITAIGNQVKLLVSHQLVCFGACFLMHCSQYIEGKFDL